VHKEEKGSPSDPRPIYGGRGFPFFSRGVFLGGGSLSWWRPDVLLLLFFLFSDANYLP